MLRDADEKDLEKILNAKTKIWNELNDKNLAKKVSSYKMRFVMSKRIMLSQERSPILFESS